MYDNEKCDGDEGDYMTHFYENMVLGSVADATFAVRVLKFGYNEGA